MPAPRSPLPHLDAVLRLIDAAAESGERCLLELARDRLVEVIDMVKPAHPVSISGVPHLYWPPRGFVWTETASSYAGWNDRWIVSLIVGYGAEEAKTAAAACESAHDLVVGAGSEGTRWYVHDRVDGSTVVIPQSRLATGPASEQTFPDRAERSR